MYKRQVYETICYLAQLGHRRIGGIFCIDEMDDSFLIARKRGFLRAVRQMQLDQEESLIGQIHGDYEKSSLISVIELSLIHISMLPAIPKMVIKRRFL